MRTYGVSANQTAMADAVRCGELNDEKAEASVIAEYEAHIAALERKVGQLTMELDLVKKTARQATAGDSGSSSIITGSRPALSDRVQNDRSREEHYYYRSTARALNFGDSELAVIIEDIQDELPC